MKFNVSSMAMVTLNFRIVFIRYMCDLFIKYNFKKLISVNENV